MKLISIFLFTLTGSEIRLVLYSFSIEEIVIQKIESVLSLLQLTFQKIEEHNNHTNKNVKSDRNVIYCCCCSVTKSCLTLCDPMVYSPPGSSLHGISQARKLECIAISSSRRSSQPNLCLLHLQHQQVDCSPLSHWGIP